MNSRNRTPSEYVGYYGLYLYFSGLFRRMMAERISHFVKRNHVSIWNWIQKYSTIPEKYQLGEVRFQDTLFIVVDETLVRKVGSEFIWLLVAIHRVQNPENFSTACQKRERNMFVCCIEIYYCWCGEGLWKENIQFQLMVMERGTYLKACRFLRLSHHHHRLHSTFEKKLVEITIQQYIKDRTESFKDYFL